MPRWSLPIDWADVHIAIDGRMLYRDQAGIGRYVWELQRALADLPDRHERQVTLLLDPRDSLRCSTGIMTQALAVPAAVTPAPA